MPTQNAVAEMITVSRGTGVEIAKWLCKLTTSVDIKKENVLCK